MIRLIRRFLADSSGNYAMIVALAAMPIFGSAAAAIEYSNVYKAKQHLQDALDAAALATAKELAVSADKPYLAAYARNFFDANLNNTIDQAKIIFDFDFGPAVTGGNRVYLDVDYTYDTYMADILGVDEIPMHIGATIAAGNSTAEIAIVIDNSGSMDTTSGSNGETRLELAQAAATSLVTFLHQAATFSNKPDPIKISVVPFGASVNVGSQYRGADWLDMKGWSSVHHENFNWNGTATAGDSWPSAIASGGGWKSATTTTVSVGPNPPNPLPAGITSFNSTWLSRWTLLDAIGTAWQGCVEMRPSPYNSDDTTPTDVTPDTLIVPMFAPDEPERRNSSEDNDYRNRYLNDYVRVGPDYAAATANYGNNTKQHNRQDWTRKYNNDAKVRNASNNILIGQQRTLDLGAYGPNQGCTTDPVQPLTNSAATAITAIANMDPGGYTNVHEGIAWGWRTLSANAPFTQGRGYDIAENDKYVIVLTDGNNTYPAQSTMNQTEYYAWGFGKDNRVSGGLLNWSSNVDAMNQQTAKTCDNIKAVQDADLESAYAIFTIAYDVPDGSSVKTLLENCASIGPDGKRYYYDVEGDAITDALAAIGNEISQLRIAQ